MLRTTSVAPIVFSAVSDSIGPKSNFHRYGVESPIGDMSGGYSVEGSIRGSAAALSLLLIIGGCGAIPPNAPLSPTALNDVRGPISKGGCRIADLREIDRQIDLPRIRRIRLISADGQAANNAASAHSQTLSGVTQILNAVSGTQIDSYNFETMILDNRQVEILRDSIREQRRSRTVTDKASCNDVQSYVVHLSLAGVPDPATREHLQAIPTGLDLSREDAAMLMQAGERQVLESTVLAAFRASLGSASVNDR